MKFIAVSLLVILALASKQAPAKLDESKFTKRDWQVYDQGWMAGYDSGWFALIDAQFNENWYSECFTATNTCHHFNEGFYWDQNGGHYYGMFAECESTDNQDGTWTDGECQVYGILETDDPKEPDGHEFQIHSPSLDGGDF